MDRVSVLDVRFAARLTDGMSPEMMDALAAIGVVVRPVVLVLLLAGLYRSAALAGFSATRRTAITAVAGAVLTLWYAAIWILAVRGAFVLNATGISLALPSAIDLPLLAAFVVLPRLDVVKRPLDAVPTAWLVGIQTYRVIGGVFLLEMIRGRVPGEFAWSAACGDMLTGVLAGALAWRIARSPSTPSRAIYVWNAFGILDLVVAQALGVMTSPGRLHVLALAHPNFGIGTYPSVMTPAYAVPLSLILHGLSIWQLRRRASRNVASPASSAAGATAFA